MNLINFVARLKAKAQEIGFLELSISNTIIPLESQEKFNQWIDNNYHGEMEYLANNRSIRFNPSIIKDNTISIISVKMPYLTRDIDHHKTRLNNKNQAYISSYALGRDYHKVVKQKLNQLAYWMNEELSKYQMQHDYRVFTDSAPIMEIELAKLSGNGWRGKHTLLINKNHGSMFFLGELFTNLPLPTDIAQPSHCGSCHKCLDVCPTNAFVAPYILDARKCISYLTIENKSSIPLELRKKLGNRIYGCDDCQLFCPWNKFAVTSTIKDFMPRHNLDSSTLLELFSWSEHEFTQKTQGSPIYRIGYIAWLRNLAIGLGNAPYHPDIVHKLKTRLQNTQNTLLQEHITWAITEQLASAKIL